MCEESDHVRQKDRLVRSVGLGIHKRLKKSDEYIIIIRVSLSSQLCFGWSSSRTDHHLVSVVVRFIYCSGSLVGWCGSSSWFF